jgi:hypothetical protein
MPGNPRSIVAEAERQFPIRIIVWVPEVGIGARCTGMTDWLDENCEMGAWSICRAGMRGVLNDAVAVYVNTPICAVSFVARWCVPSDPPGFYDLRSDDPPRLIPGRGHSSPTRGA